MMNKVLWLMLLLFNWTVYAQQIQGDTNHDGNLSGEEQYWRDNPPLKQATTTPPRSQKHVSKEGGVETVIETGYGQGFIKFADGRMLSAARLERLQNDIQHEASADFKQRTAESNTIVQARAERETLARIIDNAEKDHASKEALLWNLRIAGYKHIQAPLAVLNDAKETWTEIEKRKLEKEKLEDQRMLSRSVMTNSYYQWQTGQVPSYELLNQQLYGYQPLPTIRNGRLEYP
jgi:hypothetical protein